MAPTLLRSVTPVLPRSGQSFLRKALCRLLLLRRSRLQRLAEGLLSPRAASVALVLSALYAQPKLPARTETAEATLVTRPAPTLAR